MGISFIATIAIPEMVIRIPVYVDRKIHCVDKGKQTSNTRNLAIPGRMTLSVIASSVITAVRIAFGIPIMLAYINVTG